MMAFKELNSEFISVWLFSMYGGLTLTSPGEEFVKIGALTGSKRASERTALYAKWAAGEGALWAQDRNVTRCAK